MKVNIISKILGGVNSLALTVSFLFTFAYLGAFAKTTTWQGGSSGLFSVAGNWNNGAPDGGDTCVFNSAVTLEDENFDFGSAGITLENSATLTVLTHFAGSGGIIKRGNGDLAIKSATAGTFTGDVTIEAGRLYLASGSSIRFGQGKIVFTQTSASSYFITQGEFYSQNLQNDVEFRGESSDYAIYLCRNGWMSGTISSLHDFRVGIPYLGYDFGAISAPGHTVTIEFPQSWNDAQCNLNGSINASLVKKGSKNTYLNARSDYIDNTLRVEGGTLILEKAASYWGGTNVQVVGSSSVLRLNGSQNLSTMASVQLLDGGKLNLGSSCALTVAKLVVNGVEKDVGTYDASNLSDCITGSGTITVSPKIWIGGASGYLSAAGNWSDAVAPSSGDVLTFTNSVELLNETVNVGVDGLVLSSGNFAISNHVWFTGVGGVTKRGTGRFYQFGDAGGDFAGGARFEGGSSLWLVNRYLPGRSTSGHKFFGRGAITLDGNRTRIFFDEWACGVTNTIVISDSLSDDAERYGSVTCGQGSCVIGPIVAYSDFKIHSRDWDMSFPSIEAPGCTVLLDSYLGSVSSGIHLDGPVNANVTRQGGRPIFFNGSSPNENHTLTLSSGTNTFSAAAYWGGAVSVSGATTCLKLMGSGNLSLDATLNVSSGAKLEIPSDVCVKVGHLYVDGVEQPNKTIYRASNLPAVITGGGRLRVGTPGLVLTVK